jgi:hypothetical protein
MDSMEQKILELVQLALKEANNNATPKYKSASWYLQHSPEYRQKANKWAADSYHRNRDKVLEKKSDRYKNDEAFREQCKERARRSREKRKQEKLDKEAKLKEAS